MQSLVLAVPRACRARLQACCTGPRPLEGVGGLRSRLWIVGVTGDMFFCRGLLVNLMAPPDSDAGIGIGATFLPRKLASLVAVDDLHHLVVVAAPPLARLHGVLVLDLLA